jgi:hypothetical protein
LACEINPTAKSQECLAQVKTPTKATSQNERKILNGTKNKTKQKKNTPKKPNESSNQLIYILKFSTSIH